MKLLRNKGFSLVELLVVVAIIGVLAGIVILRIVSPKYDVEIESTGNIIQSTAIKARDLARAPQQGGVITDAATTNGYGILFPAVGTTDISSIVFRDIIDSATPANQNKWVDPSTTTFDDVNISTTWLRDSDIKNVKVLKYIVYDASNNMSEDTVAGTRNFVFLSSDTPTKEKVYYGGNSSFTRVGISIQHEVTKKEIRIFIHANGEITVENYVPPTPKTLTISYSGTGTGTATPSPSGTVFSHGTSVSVTAAPTGGSSFGGWSGACSGFTNPCVITMDANKTLTVTFSPPPPPPPPPFCGDGTCNNGETWQTCSDCPIPVTVSNFVYTYNTVTFTAVSANGSAIKVFNVNALQEQTYPSGSRISWTLHPYTSGLNGLGQLISFYNDDRIFFEDVNYAYQGVIVPGDTARNFTCNQATNTCTSGPGYDGMLGTVGYTHINIALTIVP